MSTDPNLPNSNPRIRVRVSEMEQEEGSSSVWNWGDLLDFSLDDADPLILPWDISDPPPPPTPMTSASASASEGSAAKASSGRVRKRDPRLVCENYLAGRVPCACPEVDEMMLREEEEGTGTTVAEEGGERKRARVRGAKEAGPAVVRCQVPGCQVDIMELKGYHRRHRVCLGCANAPSVVIDGEDRRYCQQCGKFHLMPDFDEGKRSCRRKLERHNKRRRRRLTDNINVAEKENKSQADLSTEATYDEEAKKDNAFVCGMAISSKVNDGEIILEPDEGLVSPICSLPSSENMQTDNILSFPFPDETNTTNEEKNNPRPSISSAICDDRGTYSSVCPTGRLSFKLYDWNPAEFPRRLRHQIFQWLASMPVELEGYIRPGCTILTIFIAMPQFMWQKLSQNATFYIKDLIDAPDSLLWGRGSILIFIGNMIIQVLKDGSSLENIKVEVKAPRIHYVHPTYFEAGKPMEFIACGSNLNQPKFRFLVSFAGKYMVYDSCSAISHGKIMPSDGNKEKSCHDTDHEMFRVHISQTHSKTFGPAFVEVENESGLSNFIPILVGNKHICSDLDRMQVSLSGSFLGSLRSETTHPSYCKLFVAKQTALSELLVDIAWLLKEPCLDKNEVIINSVNLQRLSCLLKVSVENELVYILEVVLKYLEVKCGSLANENLKYIIPDANLNLLQGYIIRAKELLNQRSLHDMIYELNQRSRMGDVLHQSCVMSAENQDGLLRDKDCMHLTDSTVCREHDESAALVGTEIVARKHYYPLLHVEWTRNSWLHSFSRTIGSTYLSVFVMVSVVMCLGACIVLHPLKPGDIIMSIRRSLFSYPFP